MPETTIGETRHAPFATMHLHRHRAAYIAVVLDGSYEECGPDGRFRCGVGGLIVHPPWHCHADEFGGDGAVVLNLPLPTADGLTCAEVADVAAIESLARRSPEEAARAALEEAHLRSPLAPAAWLEDLTRRLALDDDSSVAELASRCGVSAEHASRACRRWFGVGPAELRREQRLRRAMGLLEAGATPSVAAVDAGFSDQPHLTRLLKRATGHTPGSFPRH